MGPREDPEASIEPLDLTGEWYLERIKTRPFQPPIFLSYSTPTNKRQFEMAKEFYRFLARRQLAPRTLGVNEYDFAAPLRAIRRLIGSSDGFLAIAFKKTVVEKGSTSRRHGHQPPVEEELVDKALASPWIQVEAAMAYQREIPILILREKGVLADGLLEPGVVSQYMPEFDLSGNSTAYLRSDEFKGIMTAWENEVRHWPQKS